MYYVHSQMAEKHIFLLILQIVPFKFYVYFNFKLFFKIQVLASHTFKIFQIFQENIKL